LELDLIAGTLKTPAETLEDTQISKGDEFKDNLPDLTGEVGERSADRAFGHCSCREVKGELPEGVAGRQFGGNEMKRFFIPPKIDRSPRLM
jgi:hypothetical protein